MTQQYGVTFAERMAAQQQADRDAIEARQRESAALSEHLKFLGLTHKEAAELLGVHVTTIHKWTTAANLPPANIIQALNAALPTHRLTTKEHVA